MIDRKISDLTELITLDVSDLLAIVDVSVEDFETKYITISNLLASIQVYGGISVVSNAVETAIAVAGTPVQITVFDTNSPSNNATPDHTNDHVTIDMAGNYFVVVSATVNSIMGAGSRFEMEVMKNNGAAAVGALHVDRNISGGGGNAGSVSMSDIVALMVNDTIEVWIENEDNTQNYVVEDITLNLVLVGRT